MQIFSYEDDTEVSEAIGTLVSSKRTYYITKKVQVEKAN